MLFKRRVAAIEKLIEVLVRPTERPRLVFCFGDGTDPSGEKDEAPDEENGLVTFRLSRPRPPEGERVLNFDFGNGEGQTGQAIPKTKDATTDSNQPFEGEKK